MRRKANSEAIGVTDKKLVLEARLAQAGVLPALVATMPGGLILTDRQGRVAYLNAAATEMIAHQPEEVLDKPLDEALGELLLRAHEPAPLQAALGTVNLAGAPQNTEISADALVSHEIELTVANSEGEERFLRFSFFPVPTERNAPFGYGLLIQDATRDHAADQLKTEFVAVVSHELRTPLSAIQGFSELLLTQDASPERQRLWLEMINRESVRLSSLIDDMLSLSRIESGRIDLRPERVELESVVRQCVEILRVGSSKHFFKIEIEENLPAIKADRDKLIQILNNIIGNAIKYSSKGGQILIKAGYSPENPEEIKTSISDQGVGIPAAELPKVFEKFYRVRGRQSKEVKGTGLGLAITRNLVELQAGRIWVESEVGKGSTFVFTLPIHNFRAREIKAFKEILLKTLLVPGKDTSEAELYLDYLQRTLPSSQLDEVLRDTMYEVGEKWHRGEIGIGDEHIATGLIRDFLSRVRTVASNTNGLRLVVGSVAGEEHIVGLTMVANAFGRAGWTVTNLGANVPIAAFITTINQVQPNVLLLSIAMSQRLVEIKRVVQEVREAFPGLLIGVGGRLLNELPDLAERLGVDFHSTTPDETVRLAIEAVRPKKPGNSEPPMNTDEHR